MLVLARKLGEETLVTYPDGTVGTVTVVGLDRGRVRLGFLFPKSVNIARREIYNLQRKERTDADPPTRQDQEEADQAPPAAA